MQSKFAKSQARSKTPSICKKSIRPDWDDVPDYPIPDIYGNPIWLTISYRSFAPDHPWNYTSRQLLMPIAPPNFRTNISTDPDFTFYGNLSWWPSSGNHQVTIRINHQGHGLHVAWAAPGYYTHGQPFFIPRTALKVDNPNRYKGDVLLTI